MERSPIIDFHVHAFPDRLKSALEQLNPVLAGTAAAPLAELLSPERLAQFRRQARVAMGPVSTVLHQAQTLMRHLPVRARRPLDQLAGLAPIPGLLLESTAEDLLEAMAASGVDQAVVIAHEPFLPNEQVLELAQAHPGVFHAAVNIPSGTARPGERLREMASRGARLLKIHPASDGEGVDSPRYRALLKVADELGLPVILHTGCIHTHALYRDPEQGHAQRFAPWFAKYKKVRFILAHMNFHLPNIALDLAEEHGNLWVDTSWQPAESIGEAVRRIGAERVLFATDWPFVGRNLTIGLERVRDAERMGSLKAGEAELILGRNAAGLLPAG